MCYHIYRFWEWGHEILEVILRNSTYHSLKFKDVEYCCLLPRTNRSVCVIVRACIGPGEGRWCGEWAERFNGEGHQYLLNTHHVLCADRVLLHALFYLTLKSPTRNICYSPHLTDEETGWVCLNDSPKVSQPVKGNTCLTPKSMLFPLYICECVLSCFSCARLFATLWTVARQFPLSMGFPRREYWRGLPCPPPGDLPNLGI